MSEQRRTQNQPAEQASVGDVIDYVRTYAKQETVGPLSNAGKWLAWGSAGALMIGFGIAMALLAVLRLLQTEWQWASQGRWSFISYFIVLVVAVIIVLITAKQINKTFLDKEDK